MPNYRQRWQQRSATGSGRWEDAEPAYRYGHEMRTRPEYRGRTWSEMEPTFQRDWTQRNPGTPWERARDSIRDMWDDRSR
jgi:endonuclease I